MTTPLPPTADDYWARLAASHGVGREGQAFFGGSYIRMVIRHFDTIAGSGVLESLIGGSSSTGVELWGRKHRFDHRPEWFHLDIAPAFNTWETVYEFRPPDANLGPGGMITGSERSGGPMPRAHIRHPSSLVYYEQFPIWGGIRHVSDDYLPGDVDVLWQESAAMDTGEPDWHRSPTPGPVARISLINGENPKLDGTAIFDLQRQICLFFEIRYAGEPDYQLVVDAMKTHGTWRVFTEFGERSPGSVPR
ncbi:hypothetical protein [Dietzia cinnamea]|uniref:hypothetical protein n=1 Tax=Dietzia cinnamea TaxID=321318 RepID=UPI00223ADF61|nr:hypothetical protein [Dietzia cinnamea]MCT2060488.1 hypothetical protein [Dietzia cinnamea]MCT2237314.1 hypothetical protein [Dietzia cinnamea]MCT2302007.1 hypothetical protein [Dietzia cinnamea]